LSNKEKIELLEEFKKKTWFSKDAFKDRDMDWPGDHVVEEMRLDVLDFTNFLIHKLMLIQPICSQQHKPISMPGTMLFLHKTKLNFWLK
jgi:hypothetical protein